MTKFFSDLMLEEECIYTLGGSKPMTRVILYQYSEEKIKEYMDSLTKEDIKKSRLISNYDLPENWEKWKKVASRFPLKRYMLVEGQWHNKADVKFLYFVDVLKTAVTIQEHYREFSSAVGYDFDPMKVVLEMQTAEAPFWKKIETNSLLWGILFGFGKENAYAYHWKYSNADQQVASFFDQLKGNFSCEMMTGKRKRTLNNLEIPSFISFTTNDPIVSQYEREREMIRKIYSQQDFLTTTLDLLTKN
ncbi:MAG: hypothetical protein P0S96_08285 [Simkaniaceae bacterium]|nr:hypothetical protein [Candidatus Sacchlamyda saccharinae]